VKLKSAVLYQALKAAYTRLGISATYSAGSSKATFETGEFLITSAFLDSLAALDGVGTSDGAVLSVFKTFTDDSSAAEDATLAFFKVLAENGYVSEKHIFDFFKTLTDTATVTSNFTSTRTKILTDQTTVTDDLDGEATTADDQEMQFAKVTGNIAAAIDTLNLAVNYNRAFTDSYGVTDSDVLNFGKRPSDTTSMTDVGSLRSQGYADFTYFAEDYVGASRTFT